MARTGECRRHGRPGAILRQEPSSFTREMNAFRFPHPSRPLVIAHRAANDLRALRFFQGLDVDFVEGDVWLHGRRLEMRHARSWGPLRVERWKLTPPWLPRTCLADALTTLRPETGLMLDLKGHDLRLPRALGEALAGQSRPLIVSAADWRLLGALPVNLDALRAYTVEDAPGLRALENLAPGGDGGVSVRLQLLDSALVSRMHVRGWLIIAWPVCSETELGRLLEWGVDGIVSKEPSVLTLATRGSKLL